MNLTCNSTLEDMRIGSETKIAGPFTFHQLSLIISGGSAIIAILTSLYLMWRHATNYTKPTEQKHIIRILFMVPIYSASSFLCIWYYWHAVYFQVLSDCYEAFAISSFYALMCSYIAPELHDQKEYFRHMHPVKEWVMPVNWFAKCCGGQRGPWRTPKSGLTWFNIVWIGIYHYCFIRVAMTITAVVTQYYGRYCESSNNPVFAHIWVLIIESVAVSIAMYCVIQFYIQLKEPLAEHKPFLKVLAIKLVIFLSFWQSTAISLGTSTLHLVNPSDALAYPDIKVGIPSLLLCVEMAMFALLHLWAFPYQPYVPGAKQTFYPVADPSSGQGPRPNEHSAPRGGALGLRAFADALNIWDVIKAFGRGIRWLFVGVRKRHQDPSYQNKTNAATSYPMAPYGELHPGAKSTDHLPIAQQFRQSTFYGGTAEPQGGSRRNEQRNEESAGLINNAQDFSVSPPQDEPNPYLHDPHGEVQHGSTNGWNDPHRVEYYEGPGSPERTHSPYAPYTEEDTKYTAYAAPPAAPSRQQTNRSSTQVKFGNALWGDRSPHTGGQI